MARLSRPSAAAMCLQSGQPHPDRTRAASAPLCSPVRPLLGFAAWSFLCSLFVRPAVQRDAAISALLHWVERWAMLPESLCTATTMHHD